MSLRTRFIVPLLLLHDELKTNHHHQENNNNTRKEAEGGKGGKRKTPRVSLCAVLSRDNFNFPSPCNFVGCLLTLLLPLPLMLLNVLLLSSPYPLDHDERNYTQPIGDSITLCWLVGVVESSDTTTDRGHLRHDKYANMNSN